MEREQWHIFYLKVVSLITIVTFLTVTGFLAVTFGNYYAIYETQYAVKLEIQEIQRSYMSQYIYICYLGCLFACDLIACLAILYNLNYIILFAVFHHTTLLLVKVYSGFELDIPGEHSFAVLGLFVLLHTAIIVALSFLYKKLDSIAELREILSSEATEQKEQERKRLKERDQLNDRLLNEYQAKYLTGSSSGKRSSHGTARRDSTRTIELEPVDIEGDFDTIKRSLRSNQPNRNSGTHQSFDSHSGNRNVSYASHNKRNINSFDSHRKVDQRIEYDSDGYLQANTLPVGGRRADELGATSHLIKSSPSELDEDAVLDQLNKRNDLAYCRSYSVGDESTDLYFEPDCCDDYCENDYDYLKFNIKDKAYAEHRNGNRPTDLVKPGILKKSDRKPSDYPPSGRITNKQQQPLPNPRQLIDKSIQTNQSNSSNEVFYTATDQDLCEPTISANASAIKESFHQQSGQTKSRKVEYSTLKYNTKILYETSV